MKKSTRYLLILCITAVTGIFLLQFFWIRNYYLVNKDSFQKEVNLAMEDAVKKEFIVRCNTIEQRIINELQDTSEYRIKNQYHAKHKTYMLTIFNRRELSDSSSMHSDTLNKPLLSGDTAYRNKIIRYIAHNIRNNELEGHIVFYHTQRLGNYITGQGKKLDFDTTRLRPILAQLLAERNIFTSFQFYIRTNDSTFNRSTFSRTLLNQYPVISKAYLTYKQNKNDHYVRAMFVHPTGYILSKMGLLFAGSVLLILVVGFSLFYLFRSLLTEKKLSAIKNDFISNITHELKTPIASVSAAVEAMTDFNILDDAAKTQRYLSHAKSELQRLSALVDKVLNISLYEKQTFDIRPEELDIDEIINQILKSHVSSSTKKVSFTYQNSSNIHRLYADRMYFEHAINNIVDNAIKYAGDDVLIAVSCTLQQSFVAIAVQDNGIGISGVDQSMVFEKFYRVPSGNRHRVKGHGLGLSYVKSIIERHGGWYKLTSELNKGTTLTLAWPL